MYFSFLRNYVISCSSCLRSTFGSETYAGVVFAFDPEEAQVKEQLWKEYVADPSQWWDNRIGKVSMSRLVIQSRQ